MAIISCSTCVSIFMFPLPPYLNSASCSSPYHYSRDNGPTHFLDKHFVILYPCWFNNLHEGEAGIYWSIRDKSETKSVRLRQNIPKRHMWMGKHDTRHPIGYQFPGSRYSLEQNGENLFYYSMNVEWRARARSMAGLEICPRCYHFSVWPSQPSKSCTVLHQQKNPVMIGQANSQKAGSVPGPCAWAGSYQVTIFTIDTHYVRFYYPPKQQAPLHIYSELTQCKYISSTVFYVLPGETPVDRRRTGNPYKEGGVAGLTGKMQKKRQKPPRHSDMVGDLGYFRCRRLNATVPNLKIDAIPMRHYCRVNSSVEFPERVHIEQGPWPFRLLFTSWILASHHNHISDQKGGGRGEMIAIQTAMHYNGTRYTTYTTTQMSHLLPASRPIPSIGLVDPFPA
ncbi:hypothetical protein ACRALDRAFT_208469 [Sodiomyces alcalophilus JCM 7366]|uniref:uncharacterized protein n=1 Tax=Sodiomyces alcalophilus JCM 7366 TaxID=591952 RepID=UPI0039B6D0E4